MVAQIDTAYKRLDKYKLLRRIISYTLFEGRPHTTKGQWFNPFVFGLLKLIKLIPGNPSLSKPIFITGLGRSGTTILGVILSVHKDVGFLNEPKAIWSLIDPRSDINGDYVLNIGQYHLGQSDVSNDIKNAAHKIFGRYLRLVNSKRLVDKYPEFIFRIEYLLSIFPDAKIIFITRNGNDATHSINLWSKRLGVKNGSITEDWWGRNDIKWHYLCEQILKHDPCFKEVHAIATDTLDHTNRAALEWIITMREGIKQKAKHPDSIYQIKYEDIVSHKSKAILDLLLWCDLDLDSTVVEYSNKTLHSNNPKPYPILHETIDTLFRDTMKALGY